MQRTLKAFTLIELMISTSIMGILFIIIFQIYTTIARLTVRIEQEKYVTQELVYAMQTIQNIVDTTHIDRSGYNLQELESNKGISDTLYLADSEHHYILKRACENGDIKCKILLLKDGQQLVLTQSDQMQISDLDFKLLPWSADQTVREKEHEGFWLNVHAQSAHYNPAQRQFNVETTIQTFFTMRT